MGFTKAAEDDGYLVLLGRIGRVAWRHHGVFAPIPGAAARPP